MNDIFRVGNAAGFSGDRVDAAAREALALYCCGPAGGGGVRWRTTPRIRTQSYLMLPSDLAPGCSVQTAAQIAP